MTRALVLVLLSGCGVREAGIEVSVQLDVRDALSFDAATLAVQRVELERCDGVESWLRQLNPISTAYAHGLEEAGNPRVADVATLLDLSTIGVQPVAVVKPPPGDYCSLMLTFSPSTADAREQGTTLYVEGEGTRQLSTRIEERSLSFDSRTFDETTLRGLITVALTPSLATDGDASLQATLSTLTLE